MHCNLYWSQLIVVKPRVNIELYSLFLLLTYGCVCHVTSFLRWMSDNKYLPSALKFKRSGTIKVADFILPSSQHKVTLLGKRHRNSDSLSSICSFVLLLMLPSVLHRLFSSSLFYISSSHTTSLHFSLVSSTFFLSRLLLIYFYSTRWFKYDWDYLCVNKSQPPCIFSIVTVLWTKKPGFDSTIKRDFIFSENPDQIWVPSSLRFDGYWQLDLRG